MAQSKTTDKPVRLDQWLHAARFFKTRGLSAQAIKSGKVTINGSRTKPAHPVHVNDTLTVKRGPQKMELVVLELSTRRASASIVSAWYEETPQSKEARERLQEQLRLSASSVSAPPKRPDKKSRRQIIRFIRDNSSE